LRQLGVIATGSTALALDSFEYDDTRLGLLVGTVQVEQAIVDADADAIASNAPTNKDLITYFSP
jgi:hypothetical protein